MWRSRRGLLCLISAFQAQLTRNNWYTLVICRPSRANAKRKPPQVPSSERRCMTFQRGVGEALESAHCLRWRHREASANTPSGAYLGCWYAVVLGKCRLHSLQRMQPRWGETKRRAGIGWHCMEPSPLLVWMRLPQSLLMQRIDFQRGYSGGGDANVRANSRAPGGGPPALGGVGADARLVCRTIPGVPTWCWSASLCIPLRKSPASPEPWSPEKKRPRPRSGRNSYN